MKTIFNQSVRVGLAATLLASSSLCIADSTIHYRWTNEKGGTVYSDRPPPKGVDYEVVSSASGLKRIVEGEEGAVPLEVDPNPGNDFDQINTRHSTAVAKNQVLCDKAKMNLIALEDADVVKTRNDKGELKELSAEEREIARQTANMHIELYCP